MQSEPTTRLDPELLIRGITVSGTEFSGLVNFLFSIKTKKGYSLRGKYYPGLIAGI